MITCPICAEPVDIPGPALLSEIVECADCKSELEVIALDPVMVALAPEVEEDWGE